MTIVEILRVWEGPNHDERGWLLDLLIETVEYDTVGSLSVLARRLRVTRTRTSRIMALNRLAPEIQERLLLPPRADRLVCVSYTDGHALRASRWISIRRRRTGRPSAMSGSVRAPKH